MTRTLSGPRTSANARRLVSFYELAEEWQEEAKSNNGEYAEDVTYIMPRVKDKPNQHVLWDLMECMPSDGDEYTGIIPISNCCAMGIKISECGDLCWLTAL